MNWAKRGAGLALFFALWEIVARSGAVPGGHFPNLPAVFAAMAELAPTRGFWTALGLTWARALAGLAIAIVLGLGLAILAGRYALVRRVLEPAVEMLRVLPPPALVPLAIFTLGLGLPLFLFIIAFAAIWPVYVNAANALATVEPVQVNTGRAFGYGEWAILLRLRLPLAMPDVFTGIRLAAGLCLLAAVAVEMLAGQNGLGFLLYDAAFTLRTADLFALLMVAGLSGVAMNALVAGARRLASGWHAALAATASA